MPKSKTLKGLALSKAWERLEVKPEDLQKHAKITPLLVKALGSLGAVMEVLRGSDAKEAMEVIRLWDLATKAEQKAIPLEAFCLSAKTTPKKMIGIIVQALVEQSDVITELILAGAKTEVVQKTVKLAKTTKGQDERKIVLQNRGVMAAPKNQVFNNFGSVTQDNRKQIANVSVSQLEEDSDRISKAVDDFSTTQLKRLPGKVEVIDATLED